MEFYVMRDKEPTKKNGEENELMHYGILGMKWGVRRYQDKKGRLTAAGKERYGKGQSAKHRNYIDKGSSYDSAKAENDKKARDISKELLSGDEMRNMRSQRTIDAAVTGMNALKVLDSAQFDEFDPNNWSDQAWFLMEDQTMGLPQIADLANKGYSAEKISSMIKEGLSAYRNSNDYYSYGIGHDGADLSGLWYLDEGYSNPDFIKACVDYVKKKQN